MGRQTAFGGDAAGADHGGRLDPFALPVTFALPQAGEAPGGAGHATLDRTQIVLRNGAGSTMLPIRSYRGVAVRVTARHDGALSAALELHHTDPAMRVTLLVVNDPADLAADWQAWSRSLGLPMLLIEADGSLSRPFPAPGVDAAVRPKPRRMHSYFAGRRPRFLARRKTGWQREAEVLGFDEIIARN